MATAKNTSLVKNTARQVTLKGNAASSKNKRPAAKKPTKHGVAKRRNYRRNPANDATAGLLAAFGGALVINSFDLISNRFAPSVSGLLRTGVKFGLGFAVGAYGSKLPLVGRFSGTIRNALYLAGALDLVGSYVMPKVTELINGASSSVSNLLNGNSAGTQVVATSTTTDPKTGELGYIHTLSNGQTVEVYNQPAWRGNFAY